MRLATLAEYMRMVYAEGSAPRIETLRRRIKEIPGGRVELGRYYVDLDKHDQATDAVAGLDSRRDKLRKKLADKGLI